MTEREPDYRPRAERSVWPLILLVLALLAAGYFGWRWWQAQQQVSVTARPPSANAPDDRPDQPAPLPAPPAPTGPLNPLDKVAEPDGQLPALPDADSRVRDAVSGLTGSGAAGEFLQLDGFVRRAVATVDNLPRGHAAPALWPVRPTGGRLVLEEAVPGAGDTRTLSPQNSARYSAFVRFAEAVDPAAGAKVYARLYPLFQQAYEELGYPGQYFNDRLVAVIDHLLAAPEREGPLAIRAVQVRGEVPSERPWVRYEFADPALEELSAGHKLMLRVGPENAQRLKAVLRKWRAQVAKQ